MVLKKPGLQKVETASPTRQLCITVAYRSIAHILKDMVFNGNCLKDMLEDMPEAQTRTTVLRTFSRVGCLKKCMGKSELFCTSGNTFWSRGRKLA